MDSASPGRPEPVEEKKPVPPTRIWRRRPHTGLAFVLEFVLVAMAVFLGLVADQWRDDRRDRRLAQVALMQFREEVAANKAAVERVVGYHTELRTNLSRYVMPPSAPPLQAFLNAIQFSGFKPVHFESTARDLAVATQSLSLFDRELALAITRVYGRQDALDDLQSAFTQGNFNAVALSPANFTGLALSMGVYLEDVINSETILVTDYEGLLSRIDAALAL
jgi:hypothetical protein